MSHGAGAVVSRAAPLNGQEEERRGGPRACAVHIPCASRCAALRVGEFVAGLLELALELLRLRQLVALRLPLGGERIRLLLKLSELLFQQIRRTGNSRYDATDESY